MKRRELRKLIKEELTKEQMFTRLVDDIENILGIHAQIQHLGSDEEVSRFNSIMKNYNMMHLIIK